MKEGGSTEKRALRECPYLPAPLPSMSYRDLRRAEVRGEAFLFEAAQRYTAYLLRQGQPARAILALCRAFYLDPGAMPVGSTQPYAAYAWILQHACKRGFLGNPRVSFHHQASRMRPTDRLKIQRAWALWHLTRRFRPNLPPDPRSPEDPPSTASVAESLDRNGLAGEGRLFLEILESDSGTGLTGT